MARAVTNALPDEGSPELTAQVLSACASLGFALAGVTDAAPTAFPTELNDWVHAGKHGEMTWLAEDLDVRADPRLLMPGARSIVMVADRYAPKRAANASGSRAPANAGAPAGIDPNVEPHDDVRGTIAKYAQGLDYHAVMKKRLHTLADALRQRYPGHDFRAFVDTAPVLEREHAARAGLGFIGKHTLLINPSIGSYVLLGGLLTTLRLAPTGDEPPDARPDDEGNRAAPAVLSRCGSCTRCIDACPTSAITPWSVDARRCISYLTIEHRTDIEPSLRAAMGDWLIGCDICQDVCPFNQARDHDHRGDNRDAGRMAGIGGAAGTGRAGGTGGSGSAPGVAIHPAYTPRREALSIAEVMGWTETDRTREFSGAALKRVTLDMLKRNATIVLNNSRRDAD